MITQPKSRLFDLTDREVQLIHNALHGPTLRALDGKGLTLDADEGRYSEHETGGTPGELDALFCRFAEAL